MLVPINLSPKSPVIDAGNLAELVDAYITDAHLRVASRTASTYDYHLTLLLDWWATAGPILGYRLDGRGWSLFEVWLSRRLSSQSGEPLTLLTRRSCLARCKQMLRWAYRHGYLDRDFSDQVPSAKGTPTLRDAPGLDDLARLLIAANESSRPLRDVALIAVFVGTGVRRTEAAGLTVEDVTIHADGGGVLTVRHAKLNKPRRVVFDRVCGAYLSALLDGESLTNGPLFTGWKGQKLTPKSIYRITKDTCKRAGVDERGRGPHDLRRTFATQWMRHRRDPGAGQLLSMQLGHTSQAMSLHYSRQTLDDLTEAFTSPLGQMEPS